jgi:hypothetical protein
MGPYLENRVGDDDIVAQVSQFFFFFFWLQAPCEPGHFARTRSPW